MSQEVAQPGIGLPPGQVASLTVVRGPDQGQRTELTEARTVIGRRQGGVVLADREVSGLHAAIEATEGGFLVRDLGSTNGTFVDGERVSSKTLSSGCHLKCGASYLLFEIVEIFESVGDAEPVEDELPSDAGEPLIAATAGRAEPWDSDLGLGAAPTGFDEDLPEPPRLAVDPDEERLEAVRPLLSENHEVFEPPEAALLPPVFAPAPKSAAPPPVPATPSPPLVAAPAFAGGAFALPSALPIPPAGPPSAGRSVQAPELPVPPAARAAASPPKPEAAPPPRVGVTSHGAKAESRPGSAWGALPLPSDGFPIPPSPGASPHVATPLPGSLKLPLGQATVPFPSSRPERAAGPPPERPPLPPGVKTSPHDLYLVVEAGADMGKVFPIVKEFTVLGRSELGLQIHDPDVSRQHVALELQGRGPHLLRDLGSTNGTLLNGMKVTENLISPNDILRMGVTRLKLIAGPEALRAELERLARG